MSVLADAPANVTVKPVLPAPVDRGAGRRSRRCALSAAGTLALLIAAPPAPRTAEVTPLIGIWKDWVVALKPASVDLLRLVAAGDRVGMPAAVLFWPRTIGTLFAPL